MHFSTVTIGVILALSSFATAVPTSYTGSSGLVSRQHNAIAQLGGRSTEAPAEEASSDKQPKVANFNDAPQKLISLIDETEMTNFDTNKQKMIVLLNKMQGERMVCSVSENQRCRISADFTVCRPTAMPKTI